MVLIGKTGWLVVEALTLESAANTAGRRGGGGDGVLASHVLGAGGLALLHAQVGDVERRHVHVVRAHLVAQRPVPVRARQREAVHLQLVALVFVDVVQHVVQDLTFKHFLNYQLVKLKFDKLQYQYL